MNSTTNKIDKTALKFNQFSIVILTAIAFILNEPLITGFVAVVMLVGTIFPNAGLFKLFYKYVIKKTGLLKPNFAEEDNTPHQFAQGLGGIFLLISFLLLSVFNLFVLGWILNLLVLALAIINLTVSFCLGCFIYYQLYKTGLLPLTHEAKN